VILWNAETGQPVHRYRALEGAARSLSFHPNGQQLAAGLNSIVSGYSLHVWDLRTHRTVQRSHAHTGPIQVVRYSEDGSRILTAGGHDVRLWESNSWQLIQRFDLGERRVHSADLSPDGQTVMASTDRGDVTAWTVGTGVPIHTGVHHTNNIYGARFAVGGTDIITGGTDRTLRRLDLESGVATKLAEFPGRIYWLDRHPDGVHVGIPTSDGRAFLWNLNTGTQRPLIGHTHEVNELAFSRDGTFAVTASDDRTVRVWDVETGQPRWRGPALLRSPPTLVSHRGWQTLPSPAARAPDAAWARALIERARFASDSGEGDTLCVQTRGGFELWDRRTDSLRASQDGAIDGVMALGRGCVAWTDQQIWLYDAEGHARRLTTEGPVSAVGSTGDTLLVAVQEGLTSQVLSVDTATLTTETRWTVKVNVTAITESHGVGVIGYDDGGVEVLSPDGDTVALVLSATDSTDIVALLEGPQETVIVGFSGGQIGLWSQADGTKLAVGHLHGRVVHTFIQDQFLYAATDLGEYLTWDLSAFYLSRCELLREIWARVPTVWRGGRPVAEPPPAGHECLATN
jgi:outer membrane protein assembly factor BamB